MANQEKVAEAKKKVRAAAEKDLKRRQGFPVPPTKAVSNARKASKNLAYPLPPYIGANFYQLYRWAWEEWKKLGRWQNVALPVIILTALLTWEKEKALQEEFYFQLDKLAIKEQGTEMYEASERTPKRRKLLGFIPLPLKR